MQAYFDMRVIPQRRCGRIFGSRDGVPHSRSSRIGGKCRARQQEDTHYPAPYPARHSQRRRAQQAARLHVCGVTHLYATHLLGVTHAYVTHVCGATHLFGATHLYATHLCGATYSYATYLHMMWLDIMCVSWLICVVCLIYMRLICVAWLIHTRLICIWCDSVLCVCHDSFINVLFICVWRRAQCAPLVSFCVWCNTFLCDRAQHVAWSYLCVVYNIYMRYDSSLCVCHDSFICVWRWAQYASRVSFVCGVTHLSGTCLNLTSVSWHTSVRRNTFLYAMPNSSCRTAKNAFRYRMCGVTDWFTKQLDISCVSWLICICYAEMLNTLLDFIYIAWRIDLPHLHIMWVCVMTHTYEPCLSAQHSARRHMGGVTPWFVPWLDVTTYSYVTSRRAEHAWSEIIQPKPYTLKATISGRVLHTACVKWRKRSSLHLHTCNVNPTP